MSDENSKFTLTFKYGAGFTAPWLVIRANTLDELKNDIGTAYNESHEALGAGDLPLAISLAARQMEKAYAVTALTVPAPAPEQAPTASVPAYEAPAAVAPPAQQWGAAPAAPAAPAWGTAPQAQAQAPAPPAQAQPQYAPAPPAADGQPAGPVPVGASGFPMVWKTGVGKTGKPWKAWFSGQPRETPDHLKDPAVFLR